MPKKHKCLLVSGHQEPTKGGVRTDWHTDACLRWTNRKLPHGGTRKVAEILCWLSAMVGMHWPPPQSDSAWVVPALNWPMNTWFTSYRSHAGGLLRVTWSGIYCWMFLKAGKTQQFPFHSWNHACSARLQGPLSPPVSVSWKTISKGNSHLCQLWHYWSGLKLTT